jgi:hypothetical protein
LIDNKGDITKEIFKEFMLDSLDPNQLNFRNISNFTFDLTSKLHADLLFWTNLVNFKNLVKLTVSTNKFIELEDLMEVLPKLKSIEDLTLDLYMLPLKIKNLLQMKQLKYLKINVERSFDTFMKLKRIQLQKLELIKSKLHGKEIKFLRRMLLESSIVEFNIFREGSYVKVESQNEELMSIVRMNIIKSNLSLLMRIPVDVYFNFRCFPLKRTLNDFDQPSKKLKF